MKRYSISSLVNGLISPWNSPGQNTGVGSHSLLQGIFPTQELNPGLPHCRQILYQLSHQGNPSILEWVAYPVSRESSDPWVEPKSPALQADSLPAELPGNPSLVNMNMQIKISMRHYFISTKIVKIICHGGWLKIYHECFFISFNKCHWGKKKITVFKKCWQGYEEIGILIHCQ